MNTAQRTTLNNMMSWARKLSWNIVDGVVVVEAEWDASTTLLTHILPSGELTHSSFIS